MEGDDKVEESSTWLSEYFVVSVVMAWCPVSSSAFIFVIHLLGPVRARYILGWMCRWDPVICCKGCDDWTGMWVHYCHKSQGAEFIQLLDIGS